MPRGSAVIRYGGKRGTVWRIKYADADGRQVMETVGSEREGWTQKKAEAELRERSFAWSARATADRHRSPSASTPRRGSRKALPAGAGSRARFGSTGASRGGWSSTSARSHSRRFDLGTSRSTWPRNRQGTVPRSWVVTLPSCTRSSRPRSSRSSSTRTRQTVQNGPSSRGGPGESSSRSK
jgi:hypothetical protein